MQARTAIGEKYYLIDFRYRVLTGVLDAHAPPGYIGNSDLGTDIGESDAGGNSYDRAAGSHVTSGTVTENGLSDARLVGSYEVGTVVGSVVDSIRYSLAGSGWSDDFDVARSSRNYPSTSPSELPFVCPDVPLM